MDRVRLPGVSSFYASPVAADGRIYLTDRDGTTLVIKQADKLEVLATNKLGEPIDASPALAGKQLFLRARSTCGASRRSERPARRPGRRRIARRGSGRP